MTPSNFPPPVGKAVTIHYRRIGQLRVEGKVTCAYTGFSDPDDTGDVRYWFQDEAGDVHCFVASDIVSSQ